MRTVSGEVLFLDRLCFVSRDCLPRCRDAHQYHCGVASAPHLARCRSQGLASCARRILAPIHAVGKAVKISATGYQCGPRFLFQVATAPAVATTVPIAAPTSACFMGLSGARRAVTKLPKVP